MACLASMDTLLTDLFSSKLLEAIVVSMEVSQELSNRRKLVLELIVGIAKMKERL